MLHPETEITAIPPLTDAQQALLEWHSVLNVIGVIASELTAVGARLGGDGGLCRESLAATAALDQAIRAHPATLLLGDWVERFTATVLHELENLAGPLPTPDAGTAAVAEIGGLLAILAAREREREASTGAADHAWDVFFVEELLAEFGSVLAAMEQIARGRYRIRVNEPRRQATDYCVRFRFVADRGTTIWMPRALVGVVRDLVANARKYTAPGGTICADLNQAGGALHFSVTDDGRGIPAEEIPAVVHFGQRGSNVTDVRTLGGGFGLTRAFVVTQRHGGRLWLASAAGQGTRVRLEIPRPLRHK